MAQLIVRNIEDEVTAALKRRAASNGRSAEAEHRDILRRVLLGDAGFKVALASTPDVGEDLDLERRQDLARVIDLS